VKALNLLKSTTASGVFRIWQRGAWRAQSASL